MQMSLNAETRGNADKGDLYQQTTAKNQDGAHHAPNGKRSNWTATIKAAGIASAAKTWARGSSTLYMEHRKGGDPREWVFLGGQGCSRGRRRLNADPGERFLTFRKFSLNVIRGRNTLGEAAVTSRGDLAQPPLRSR